VSEFIHPYSLQLSGYSKGVRPQYRDYLQAKSFVGDITESVKDVEYSISESSREMIGTMEQIHERGYELVASSISEMGSQLSEGFETVSWKLDDISEGIDALNAKFDWGFSRMIAGIGRVNDSLQELVAIAKTPAETWAYEQYEIARDAIRRGLYPEAAEALLKAINGHGDHVGYKLWQKPRPWWKAHPSPCLKASPKPIAMPRRKNWKKRVLKWKSGSCGFSGRAARFLQAHWS
jgi:hypothetical protein